MPIFDVEAMLSVVSTDVPCGPELEYSQDYVELARLVEGSPEVQYGQTCVAAVEPDWKAINALAPKLFAQSHDLRLAVWLTRAWQALHGFAGLADGLALIEGLLARYWEPLHPQLDAADDNDPTARINILAGLDEQAGLVRQVHTAWLVQSPLHGAFSLRDLDIVAGEWAALPGAAEPDAAAIDAAFASCAFGELDARAQLIEAACEHMARIDAMLTEFAGHSRAISLTALHQLLRRAATLLRERLERHPGRPMLVAASAEGERTGSASHAETHDIVNRVDVVREIDRLCAYYERHEPGSPVPLLLQRARRLVNLSFIEIVSDLSPGSLGEVKHIAGIEPAQ
ncbi:type VI secretion system protein TssA [Trinickia sp. LjRoot230]|uniref:type VI secretion system protein TssA n=1 Tax=Trinickia sp. LjRoot230 TaxID=3342288 RepID=UPI003ECE9AAD